MFPKRTNIIAQSSFVKSAPYSQEQHHLSAFKGAYTGYQSKVQLLNITVDNFTMRELLEKLHKGMVITPNVDHLVKLQSDREFYNVYQQSEFCICDSQILMYAARFLGTPFKEKLSGSDLFPAFCRFHRSNPKIKIFLMGGAPGVAETARQKINSRIGREIIIAAHSPSFGFEKNADECAKLVEMIQASGATVLAVGVGAPKQEKWIAYHRHLLSNIDIFMAVGATIDFEAGNIRRAPKWVSRIGMEWLFRIMEDPKRLWKRYLVDDLPFFSLILKQKLGIYKSPFE